MDKHPAQSWIEKWNHYFPNSELPILFYYTHDERKADKPKPGVHCLIAHLAAARKGRTIYLDLENIGCSGGKRYLGFSQKLRPHFPEFLSCGIPGELEGERYKKTPALVGEMMKNQPSFQAPGKGIVFKLWDTLEERDDPVAVIFFAQPDMLSGLFTLANFDEASPHGVIAPMGSGCSSIVYYPYFESQTEHPRAVLGMFDVSARPYVPKNTLTMTIPWKKFLSMLDALDESFLITPSWAKIKARM